MPFKKQNRFFIAIFAVLLLLFFIAVISQVKQNIQTATGQMAVIKSPSIVFGSEGPFLVDNPDEPLFVDDSTPSLDLSTAEPENYAAALIELINHQRAVYSIEPLQVHWSVRDLAEARVIELSQDFSNKRPDGTTVRETYRYVELRNNTDSTPYSVFNSWMDTTVGESVILNESYIHAGVAYYQDENGNYYWVLLLSRK